MPRKVKRKLERIPTKGLIIEKQQKSYPESYTYMIMGAIAVLIVGFLILVFARGNRITETSSINTEDQQTSSTYTVRPGDDLWTISENVFNDGYRWVEIAKTNNLENPGLIYSGDKLVIPSVSPAPVRVPIEKISDNPPMEISNNNSIIGNSYTVVAGDNLWDIAVRAYGDGFRWPEIAKANNLINPDLIHSGNLLKIPR